MLQGLLLSSLTVGIALAQQSKYYIGEYTASGTANPVPFPLDICLSTSYPAAYAIFSCKNSTVIDKNNYASSDSTCSGTVTSTNQLTKGTTAGVTGFANCNGPSSYMVVDQYLGSCNSWASGKTGTTTTTIAVDACLLVNATAQGQIYSRSSCNGTGQIFRQYLEDSTCSDSGAIINEEFVPLGCSFFTSQGLLNIFSAMRQCVVDGVAQRCSTGLVDYSAFVTFHNLTGSYDFLEIYQKIFSYATVNVDVIEEASDYTMILLNLTFCSLWEDAFYEEKLKSLGKTTADSGELDVVEICWICDSYECANSALCGTDDYCNINEQCYDLTATTTTSTSTTEAAKSAVGIYVSIFTLISLLLFVGVF